MSKSSQHKANLGNRNIVVCMPAYNESVKIADVIKKAKGMCSEVIVYDDGSVDNTREIAESSGALVIGKKSRGGYGMAIRELFKIARMKDADIVVTIDSDGQHDPVEIPALMKPLLDGSSDIVIGSRFLSSSNSIPRYRNFGIRTITRFAKIASYGEITDAQSGFRAYSKEAISKMHLYANGMAVSTEILLRAKENDLRISEVPVTIKYNVGNSSTHNPVSHGIGVLFSIIQYISFKHPLAFYGLPGLILLVSAAYFTNGALELFSSTRYISTNLIIISVGLTMIGVVLLMTGAIIYTLVALFRTRLSG